MGTVLVTGGTGALGVHVVRELCERGRDVRVLSRSERPVVPAGVTWARGDVRTGDGLDAAMPEVDCIVHAASNPFRRARATEVGGTTNVLAAAGMAGVAHVIYVSIVGVDAHRFSYYRAKWDAEQVVAASPVPWTIQRSTQFHELLDRMLGLPAAIRTPKLAFQSIAAADVAARLVDLVETGPAGRVDDIGGPEVLGMGELRDQRRAVAGRSAVLLPVPPLGPLRDMDAGIHLAPNWTYGTTTWRAWLEARQRT